MMTKSECQEMLDKGRFRTNLIGKKILKSHLELYELLERQNNIKTFNGAKCSFCGKRVSFNHETGVHTCCEEESYDDLDS